MAGNDSSYNMFNMHYTTVLENTKTNEANNQIQGIIQ